MDDFNIKSLSESKNEWGARLLVILTPLITEGFRSIFEESMKLCHANQEREKYLMTFQNLIARIPKWNNTIIENERKRIVEKSGCGYLEELVTCIHIVQLKSLTAMRVGQKQKKIDINIPKLDDFIHKCYIHAARKIYTNVYLFENQCPPLQIQKHNRELELIIQECILNAVRESIPIDHILKAYMDESVEEDCVEEIREQVVEAPPKEVGQVIQEGGTIKDMEVKEAKESTLTFNDVDMALNHNGKEEPINAPKTIERLEEISTIRNLQRKLDEEEEEDNEKISILNEPVSIDLGFETLGSPAPAVPVDDLFDLGNIEILA
jgi:hypothetical protein